MTQVITDSASALPVMGRLPRNLHVLAMSAAIGKKEYVDAQVAEFNAILAAELKNPPKITTSQPSPAYVHETFDACLRSGEDVVAIIMSSKMSGTYEACCLAAERLAPHYPSQKIAVVDSTSNSLDEGLAVLSAVDALADGGGVEEAVDAALSSIERSRWLFTVETFRYLAAGGRIGKAAACAANLLKICPVLTVKDAETAVAGKVRLYRKAQAFIASKCKNDLESCGGGEVYVQYAGDRQAAEEWTRKLSRELDRAIECLPIAPAVGAHVGNAMGVVYRCAKPLKGKLSDSSRLVERFNC